MKKVHLPLFAVTVVLSIALMTSCQSGKSTPTDNESTAPAATTTQETSTGIKVTKPVQTTIKTPTPTPTPTKVVAIPDYDFFPDFSSTDELYIKIPMGVHILETEEKSEGSSADFSEKCIELPAGTVLRTVAKTNPYHSETIMALRTFEGHIVGVEITRSNDGSILYDGHPLKDVFVMNESNLIESPEAEVIDETELHLWEMTDASKYYHRLIVRVDWNKDGKEDELVVNNDDSLLEYTDGKTGAQTETALEIEWWYECEKAMLCQNSQGDYAVLIQGSFVNGSDPSILHVITFDPDSMIANQENTVYINYRGGQFYEVSSGSRFLGCNFYLENRVKLNDDFSLTSNSDTEYYVGGWLTFSYTVADVNLSVWNGSKYVDEILTPGMAVVPDKTVIDSSGKGFLYVVLGDGREARMTISCSTEDYFEDLLINGKDQGELFYCSWGG